MAPNEKTMIIAVLNSKFIDSSFISIGLYMFRRIIKEKKEEKKSEKLVFICKRV
jgi:hypothetical protein